MRNLTLPENFSTTLLCMMFALLRKEKSREIVLDQEVELRNGRRHLKEVSPMSEKTEVWMCPDLFATLEETTEDKNLYGQKRPDVYCRDAEDYILFPGNKITGGKVEDQEGRYLKFLREKFPKKTTRGFFMPSQKNGMDGIQASGKGSSRCKTM